MRGIVFVLIMFLVSFSSTRESSPASADGMAERYRSGPVGDIVYGFSYPGNWELVETAGNAAGVVLSDDSRIAVIFQVRDLSGEIDPTSAGYLELFRERLSGIYPDFRITEKKTRDLAGYEGYVLDYEYSDDRDPGWKLKNRAYIAVVDGRYGVMTSYMSTPGLFSEHEPRALEIMDTFSVTGRE
jgi:hypothetical protein